MDDVKLDPVDRGLIHALQIDGRVPFARVADVLDVSENTIARRYRRLRSAGLVRVVGAVVGTRLGQIAWTVRLRCTPDAAAAIARALAARTDTFWVHVMSGGTEISCVVQAATDGEQDGLLLQKLSRTARVTSVTAHSMLQGFASPRGWAGLRYLSNEQSERLRPDIVVDVETPVTLTAEDEQLLDQLGRDGRASHKALSDTTGWSESRVKRRIEQLERLGVLSYELDIPSTVLGYQVEARLWMSVRPSGLVSVATELSSHPEVSFAAVTTGPTNLVAAVICRDSRDLYRYLTERIASLDEVHNVETAPVNRTIKRNGAILAA
ncbi:Lrp/AsnC family transcriptional regulator [Actinoplanes awajinensis]|uniref:AsnC family transcriptional regulator n=1 Tax=Actinoplanes awajinensis subsp. mycoplanecinus TaxID=135947 RepID=A0A117MQT9_9ACTN|nr:Lrp/AsnC family transcriptional regulator [Actinoplanes awajinensis]KUL30714.1 AsnC family transcriptional regulator [Actinoplanes awajinensis subsp. mycoplanecinus]